MHQAKNKPRKIFIDMEGVLADIELLMLKTGHDSAYIKYVPGFYSAIKPMDGSVHAINALFQAGFDLWIAIKPPRQDSTLYMDRMNWIATYFPRLTKKIITTYNKGLLGCPDDYLIDDKPGHAYAEEFTGELIHFGGANRWSAILIKLKEKSAFVNVEEPLLDLTVRTQKGLELNVEKIEPSQIDIADIAHALSFICRFNGHADQFYSLAQHCLSLSQLVSSQHAMQALLSEASSAYIGSIPLNLAENYPLYKEHKDRIQQSILFKYCKIGGNDANIFQTKQDFIEIECRDLFKSRYLQKMQDDVNPLREVFSSKKVVAMDALSARLAFMARFKELSSDVSADPELSLSDVSRIKRLKFMLGVTKDEADSEKWCLKNSFLVLYGTKEYIELTEMKSLGLVEEGDKTANSAYFHATENGCLMLKLTPQQIVRAMQNK